MLLHLPSDEDRADDHLDLLLVCLCWYGGFGELGESETRSYVLSARLNNVQWVLYHRSGGVLLLEIRFVTTQVRKLAISARKSDCDGRNRTVGNGGARQPTSREVEEVKA